MHHEILHRLRRVLVVVELQHFARTGSQGVDGTATHGIDKRESVLIVVGTLLHQGLGLHQHDIGQAVDNPMGIFVGAPGVGGLPVGL